jgi:hypothetical protein
VFLVSPELARTPFGIDVVQVMPDTVVMTFVDRAAGRAPGPAAAPGGKK